MSQNIEYKEKILQNYCSLLTKTAKLMKKNENPRISDEQEDKKET